MSKKQTQKQKAKAGSRKETHKEKARSVVKHSKKEAHRNKKQEALQSTEPGSSKQKNKEGPKKKETRAPKKIASPLSGPVDTKSHALLGLFTLGGYNGLHEPQAQPLSNSKSKHGTVRKWLQGHRPRIWLPSGSIGGVHPEIPNPNPNLLAHSSTSLWSNSQDHQNSSLEVCQGTTGLMTKRGKKRPVAMQHD